MILQKIYTFSFKIFRNLPTTPLERPFSENCGSLLKILTSFNSDYGKSVTAESNESLDVRIY